MIFNSHINIIRRLTSKTINHIPLSQQSLLLQVTVLLTLPEIQYCLPRHWSDRLERESIVMISFHMKYKEVILTYKNSSGSSC